jgi:hypothetical protein
VPRKLCFQLVMKVAFRNYVKSFTSVHIMASSTLLSYDILLIPNYYSSIKLVFFMDGKEMSCVNLQVYF